MAELNIVTIGEKEYQVIKTGRAHAEQVLQLTRWISKHGVQAVRSMQKGNKKLEFDNSFEFVAGLIDSLTTDALIDLFIVVVGCTKEEAEVYFDIGVLVDAIIEIYNRQQSIRRLIERFFLTQDSEEVTTEESSTMSEQLTDGQTTKS